MPFLLQNRVYSRLYAPTLEYALIRQKHRQFSSRKRIINSLKITQALGDVRRHVRRRGRIRKVNLTDVAAGLPKDSKMEEGYLDDISQAMDDNVTMINAPQKNKKPPVPDEIKSTKWRKG